MYIYVYIVKQKNAEKERERESGGRKAYLSVHRLEDRFNQDKESCFSGSLKMEEKV